MFFKIFHQRRQSWRRLPVAQREDADNAVQDMSSQGLIDPSESPWASPIVLVRKDGSLRFCVDYRALNSITRKDSYPLPRIDDTLDTLAGMTWFSTLDLKSGYWQVEMDPQDKEKTAFTTGRGLWQFKVMPFGLCNAPATFERLMERVLANLPLQTALVYLDDILIPGRTFSHHLANLRVVFQRLRAAKLKLSPQKCTLLQREVKFLGHVIGPSGVSTDPEKTKVVKTWPTPTNLSELRSFLGVCSYYRRFVKGFADIARPLHHLTGKGVPFEWSPEAENAFTKLKSCLTTTPVLCFPLPDAQFTLDTDASGHAIGAVLSQMQKDQEQVVAYYSRTMNRAEQQYCVTRKELLAIVEAVKHFHPYLYGHHFIIRSDHAALQWLLKFRNPEGQIARWIQRLQEYDFEVKHRPGHLHTNADALSRRPCQAASCKHCERLEAKDATVHESTVNTAVQCAQLCTPSQESELESLPWSGNELKQAQREDPSIKPILEWKQESATKPLWPTVSPYGACTKAYWAQWKSLVLKNGLLYRRWENTAGDGITLQLVLPKPLQRQAFKQLHEAPTAGHLGINKTIGRIQQRFYWCNYSEDIRRWCTSCDLCASRKGPQRKNRAPMGQYNVGLPMERIALDILGPLPLSESGNQYLLIIADYFTKWPEAYPLPNQEATTVAKVLVNEMICRFGVPLEIHSDQGRNFESALFQEMCRLLGMTKTRTTPLHPQSDGMVERMNRTIEAQLSMFVQDHQRDWDEFIPLLMMAYRSSIHDTTKCSPAKLMLGRELRLPLDLLLERPPQEEPNLVTPHVDNLQQTLETVHEFARSSLKLSSDRSKMYYDTKSSDNTYSTGDPVWLYNPKKKKGVSPKLSRNWEGPYTVVKPINDLVYRIQLGPRTKPKVVHWNRLWRYNGDNPPKWLDQQQTSPAETPHNLAETPRQASQDEGPDANQEQTESAENGGPRRSTRVRKPPNRYNPADN